MKPSRIRPLALALGLAALASCATQQQYQEAVDLAEHYQEQLHDLQVSEARLRGENDDLRRELAIAQAGALEASGPSDELQARFADFERRLAALRDAPDGITRFDLSDGSYVYMVPDAVLFDSGSAEINADGRKALVDQVAQDIQSAAHGRIWIRGHTDSTRVAKATTLQKFPHGNIQLSAARAIEVWSVLTGAGVPESDVVVAGFGPYAPLVPNDSAENRALNRRVEILVAPAR
ncbi:MAG: OmpA family protein [Planctomycetes bacterium]|nr:OmpA family protein [Planctomycetota bacterium]